MLDFFNLTIYILLNLKNFKGIDNNFNYYEEEKLFKKIILSYLFITLFAINFRNLESLLFTISLDNI